MTKDKPNTAAFVRIGDVADEAARVDSLLLAILLSVMAQARSAQVALDYVIAQSRGVKANCWELAQAAGHTGWNRMQDLLDRYQWSWEALRELLPALAVAVLAPDHDPDDLIGPGVAIDETAQLKHGDRTAGVAAQHAGVTGKVENCVTVVFSALVTPVGQAWVTWDHYLGKAWSRDTVRRKTAAVPEDLTFATKPRQALDQLRRLLTLGLPIFWVAFDEVYGRFEELRKAAAKAGLAYVGIIPCDYQITLPSGRTLEASQALDDAVFERRSAGNGSKGPRLADWALIATAIPGQYLLLRRLLSRPDAITYYLCWAPPDRNATVTYFITIAGRRWPVEETFKTGKNVFGWDQTQVRSWHGLGRHTALTALAQIHAAACRAAIHGAINLPDPDPDPASTVSNATIQACEPLTSQDTPEADDDEVLIPLGDAPLPAHAGQRCPADLPPIKLSIAETVRLANLARQYRQGLVTRAAVAFALRWSLRRRHHQARARWHHYTRRLALANSS